MDLNKAKKTLKKYRNNKIVEPYSIAMGVILDALEQAERENRIKDGYLQLIHDLGFDYDGFNTVDNLKALIDELNSLAIKGLKNDDKSIIYSTLNDISEDNIRKGKNILFEDVEEKVDEV